MNYYSMLLEKIKLIQEDANNKLLNKINSNKSEEEKINSYEEYDNHIKDLINKFSVFNREPLSEEKKEQLLRERLVAQYEEEKEKEIAFGIANEFISNNYIVSLMIFDKDTTINNLLLKKFKSKEDSMLYFEELKNIIINNDINNLSKIILDRLD